MLLAKVKFSLTQLEYVLAVHTHGHFAKAAEACFVTQPTLSMQIQKLEEDLGIVIFDRSKKPILVTDVGARVIEQIQTVLSEVRKIDGIIQVEQSGKGHGQLVVGVIPTIAPYLLHRLLPVMDKLFPGIELRIREMQTQRILDALDRDEIDVGLLATPVGQEKFYEHALYYEPFSVLAKKGQLYADQKQIKYSTLNREQIWLMEEGHCLRNQIVDICAGKSGKNPARRYNFESGSLETLKNLVDSVGGYTLLPQLAGEDIGPNSRLIPFERPIPAREIGLVYRRKHFKSERIECLAEAILQAIPEDLRKIRPKDLNVVPVG